MKWDTVVEQKAVELGRYLVRRPDEIDFCEPYPKLGRTDGREVRERITKLSRAGSGQTRNWWEQPVLPEEEGTKGEIVQNLCASDGETQGMPLILYFSWHTVEAFTSDLDKLFSSAERFFVEYAYDSGRVDYHERLCNELSRGERTRRNSWRLCRTPPQIRHSTNCST